MFFPFFPWTLNMTNLFWGKNKNLNKANPFQLVCVNKLISFIGKCRRKNTMTIRFKPMNCCDRNVHLCNGKVCGKRVRTPFIFLCFIISKALNLRIKKKAHAIVSLQIKLNHNLWEKILNSLFLCCFCISWRFIRHHWGNIARSRSGKTFHFQFKQKCYSEYCVIIKSIQCDIRWNSSDEWKYTIAQTKTSMKWHTKFTVHR